MAMRNLYFVECAECRKTFGGPDAGNYDPKEFTGGVRQLEKFLRAEALAMMWAEMTFATDVKVLVCSPKCASDLMSCGPN